jgi:hypothetical protein
MWTQLCTVKEARGQLGIMSYRRKLYRTIADEGSDIAAHITELRSIQEQLNTMSSLVSDQEFLIALITSLPESWDQFTSSYLAANNGQLTTTTTPGNNSSAGSPVTITSHELVALILEEYRRRKEKAGESATGSAALFGKSQRTHQHSNSSKDDGCFNCGVSGHMAKDCWSKGGGKEG